MTTKKTRQEAVEALAREARQAMEKLSPMTSWERQLEEEARRRCQAEMDRRLKEEPPEDGKPKACPRCGKPARVRARAIARTFRSLWGEHTIVRNYHYCEGCKAGFFPLDEKLGLPSQGEFTEEVESRLADFAVNDSYEQAEARWRVHYRHFPVSDNQFRQVAKRLGGELEAAQLHLLEATLKPPELTAPERLYVLADGGMVPMRERIWRETKVGVVFRAEHHAPGTTSERGCVSEARYTAALGSHDAFKMQLRAALDVERAREAGEVVWIGDGAPSNWLIAEAFCPKATQVLDWYHAIEHAVTCGRELLGDEDSALPLWKERAETLLLAGNIDALLAEVEECRDLATSPRAMKAVSDLIRYYETNRERMHYAAYRHRGLLIGSGIVESAHRHVIQTRMKKAGQHWGERGGRQMARLRAAYRTAGPEDFHKAIRWAARRSRSVHRYLPARAKVDLRRKAFLA